MTNCKYCLVFLLVLLTTVVIGQEERTFKPVKGDYGFGINATGIIRNVRLQTPSNAVGQSQLFMRYYLKDDLVLRSGLGVDAMWFQELTTDSLGASEIRKDTSYSQPSLTLSLGIEKHFGNSARLDPYIGADVSVGFIGKEKINSLTIINDTTGEDITEVEYIADGGTQFATRGFVGFNYFIYPKLSLGAEYGMTFSYTVSGGDWRRTTIRTPISGVTSSTREVGSLRQQNFGFLVDNTISITLSYFFSKS